MENVVFQLQRILDTFPDLIKGFQVTENPGKDMGLRRPECQGRDDPDVQGHVQFCFVLVGRAETRSLSVTV